MNTPQLDRSFRSGLRDLLVDHASTPTSRRRPELLVAGGLGFLVLAGAGAAAVVSGVMVLPAGVAAPTSTAATQQETRGGPEAPSEAAARVRIYQNLQEVTEDSTIVVVGTATDVQRMQDDYPGALTLTDVTVTEVLKGDIEVGSTITLGDFGYPGDPPPTDYTEVGTGPVSLGGTYLLHLRPFGEYGSAAAPDQLVDGSWIFVSPFPSHYELRGDEFQLTSDWIDDTLPHAIPRAEIATRALGLDEPSHP